MSACITYTLAPDDFAIQRIQASQPDILAPGRIGEPLDQAWPDLLDLRSVLAEVLTSRRPISCGLARHTHPDIPVLVDCVPLLSGDGEIANLLCVIVPEVIPHFDHWRPIVPVAELDLLIDSIADGVIIFDADGFPRRLNKAALAIFNWQPGDLDPRTYSMIDNPYQALFLTSDGQIFPVERYPLSLALAGATPEPVDIMLPRYGGGQIVVSMGAAPLRDPLTGVITGVVSVIRDTTARTRLDQLKDEFISIASHELQAPLVPLLLACQLLMRRATQPERAAEIPARAEDVLRDAKRVSRMVADMLDLTRIRSGRFNIVPEPGDLVSIIANAVEEQRRYWSRPILVEGLMEPLPVLADPERIWQVLTNLLTNAMKYSAAPHPVEVIVARDSDASRVVVAVRDHGQGIAPDHLSHLFDLYYRVAEHEDRATNRLSNRTQQGLGLGLYIARAIVEEHGGRITVDSTVGVGSTFTFTLPLRGEAMP